jgi:hypothetical protein
MEIIHAILKTLWALVNFPYTFVGVFVGWGLGYIFETVGPNVSGHPIYVLAATGALTGLVIDLRRAFKE